MKFLIYLSIIFSFISFIYVETLGAEQYTVITIDDINIVTVNRNTVTIKVRLIGIDNPFTSDSSKDKNHKLFLEAINFLQQLILKKQITLKGYYLDENNRLLSELFYKDKNINIVLIESGYASFSTTSDSKNFNKPNYRNAQKTAQKNKNGIWKE